MITESVSVLERMGACAGPGEAVPWVREQRNPRQEWRDCKRGDWMLWLLGRLSGPPESDARKKLVLCACDCAELSLRYVKDEWVRSIVEATLEVTRAWAVGEADIERVREARSVCWSGAAYAAADAAAAAVYADAAVYAAYAATAAADAAVRSRVLAKCADVVREWYPAPPVLA